MTQRSVESPEKNEIISMTFVAASKLIATLCFHAGCMKLGVQIFAKKIVNCILKSEFQNFKTA